MRSRKSYSPAWARAAGLAGFISLLATLVLAIPVLALFQDEPETQKLTGVFTVTISRQDVPRNLAGGPALTGLWNVTFNGDGTYTLSRQDVGAVVNGTFEAGASTLTFNEWNGIIGCVLPTEDEQPARYAWQRDKDVLTLTAISDTCTERLTLLTTRPLGGFEACAVAPRSLVDPFAEPATDPFATPVAPQEEISGVAAQEELSEGADVEEAIDSLLRQANGCWATGDPSRFLALHSDRVIEEISLVGPLEEFARELRLFMGTPLAFERIGGVNLLDETHAWAYVEVTLGGDPIPQRIDFVFERGAWLFDIFFLFGPPSPPEPIVEP